MTQEDVDFLKANRDAVIEYLMNDDAVVIADPERQYEPFGMTEIQQATYLDAIRLFISVGAPATYISNSNITRLILKKRSLHGTALLTVIRCCARLCQLTAPSGFQSTFRNIK